jgi:hypothetical protein
MSVAGLVGRRVVVDFRGLRAVAVAVAAVVAALALHQASRFMSMWAMPAAAT